MPKGDRRHLPNERQYELFDLANDPKENVNVAERPENAEVVQRLDRMLDEGWTSVLPKEVRRKTAQA